MTLVVNDRYSLRRVLGGGGMGRVYLVQDLREKGLPIALKTLSPAADPSTGSLHLSHEFLVLADLAHPHIVQVHDFDRVRYVVGEPAQGEPAELIPEGTPFFTREFVAGIPFLNATARLSLHAILRLLLDLTGTVAYLHRQGLLHRDLKPDNILVTGISSETRPPRLKMLDFGLATFAGDPVGAVGTLRYLAPEIMHGSPPDTRTEMYSLGLIFYEVFGDRPPFEGASAAELARAHASLEPPPLPQEVPAPLRDLIFRQLDRDPAQRPTTDEVEKVLRQLLPPLDSRQAPFRGTLGASRLTGRDSELELIEKATIALARQAGELESPQALILTGPPGIGKSRLVQALRHRAQVRELRFLSAACQPGADAFSGGRALLQPLMIERPDLITPELEVLRTIISDRPLAPIELRTSDLSPRQAMVRICEAARTLLEAAAKEQPMVIVMEDLHWADPESLELFRHLLFNLSPRRAMLVGTAWPPGHSDSPIGEMLSDLPDVGNTCWIELEGLDTPAIGLLLQRAIGLTRASEELVERLRAQTEGNPLFIEEILKLTRGTESLEELLSNQHLPSVVGEAFRDQILSLPPGSLTALKGLAVWGTPASSIDIADITQQDRVNCLEGLEEATAFQLVRQQGNGYWFWHNVLVQILDDLMTPEESAAFHLRAGKRREASGELHDPERIGRLVTHFTRAGDAARALGYALTGARLAEERFLARRAVELYERARDLGLEAIGRTFGGTAGLIELRERLARLYTWTGAYTKAEEEATALLEDPWVLWDTATCSRLRSLLGEIATRRGELAEALDYYNSALEGCRDGQASAEVLSRIAEVHLKRGHLDEARAACAQALERLGSVDAPVLRGSIAHHLGKCAQQQADYPTALSCFSEARALYTRASYQPGVAATINAIAQIYHYQEAFALAREAFQQALELQERLGDVEGVASTLDRLALTTWGLLDTQAAVTYGKRSLEAWRRLGSFQGEAKALSTLGIIQHARAAYGEALSCFERAIERQKRAGDEAGQVVSYQNMGLIFGDIGALDEADRAIETGLELARRTGSPLREARGYQLLGAMAATRGNTRVAREYLERAMEAFKSARYKEVLADVLCGLCEIDLLEQNVALARAHVNEAFSLVQPLGRKPILVLVHVMRARVALVEPDADLRAMQTELEAIDPIASELGVPDLIWQLWEVRGRVALKIGRPREACRLLTRSMDVIHACYQQLPERFRAVYVADPRRQSVRQALQLALGNLKGDPRLSLPS